MKTLTTTTILFVSALALNLACNTLSAEAQQRRDWKPHTSAFKTYVFNGGKDFLDRQIIQVDGKHWVLLEGDPLTASDLTERHIVVREYERLGMDSVPFLRFYRDDWCKDAPNYKARTRLYVQMPPQK